MNLDIIILAAGIGKRMRTSLPKVLHTIAGIPMLEHVVNTVQALNPQNIFVVYGNGCSQVKDKLAHLQVKWAEQQQQFGTGHAVKQVVDFIDDDSQVLILYGDVPLISVDLLQQLLTKANNGFALITANLAKPYGFGRIIRTNGNITAIVEQKDANVTQQQISEINTGIITAPIHYLKKYLPLLQNNNAQQEYYLTDVIRLAVADNHAINSITAGSNEEVLGVNDLKQLSQLERYYQQQLANQFLRQGLKIIDPSRFDLRGTLEFGKDVTIDINVVLKGKVKLGNNVHIFPNCVIEDAIIEDNCQIGPFARIRPHTVVKADAEIGNFVELKNTTLGNNSKANHLSYLGDSDIGEDVNIGAGTITCNYDGANKHRTTIEDSAFVGSNCSLVAPVKIGKNTTIGAGSTITENTPDDQLVIARSRQTNIKGWQRPRKK